MGRKKLYVTEKNFTETCFVQFFSFCTANGFVLRATVCYRLRQQQGKKVCRELSGPLKDRIN